MNVGQRVTLRISRYGEIISVFLKYGFEDVIAGLNLQKYVPLLAALIVGSSVVIHSGMPPLLHGVPLIGVLGFAIAGLLAVWLLFSMLGNKKL